MNLLIFLQIVHIIQRATLITFTDDANDWDTGNVVLKVNGQTPTNYLWRNGAQPVGTTTGAANHFDIVEFKIVHDTNNEFSVFAEGLITLQPDINN